jgi:hypothetical protein
MEANPVERGLAGQRRQSAPIPAVRGTRIECEVRPSDINQFSAGGGPRSNSGVPWHRSVPKKIRPRPRRAPVVRGRRERRYTQPRSRRQPSRLLPSPSDTSQPRSNRLPCLADGWGHGSRIVDLPISACLLELPCQRRVISNSPGTLSRFRSLTRRHMMDLGTAS